MYWFAGLLAFLGLGAASFVDVNADSDPEDESSDGSLDAADTGDPGSGLLEMLGHEGEDPAFFEHQDDEAFAESPAVRKNDPDWDDTHEDEEEEALAETGSDLLDVVDYGDGTLDVTITEAPREDFSGFDDIAKDPALTPADAVDVNITETTERPNFDSVDPEDVAGPPGAEEGGVNTEPDTGPDNFGRDSGALTDPGGGGEAALTDDHDGSDAAGVGASGDTGADNAVAGDDGTADEVVGTEPQTGATGQSDQPVSSSGRSGDNVMYGTERDDHMSGAAGDDAIYGKADDDHLVGASGDDTLVGGTGNDDLRGGSGNDLLVGLEAGLMAGRETDTGETDHLNAGEGADRLVAGGNDIVQGGPGADTIVVGDWISPGQAARVTDFDASEDTMILVWDDVSGAAPEPTIQPAAGDAKLLDVMLGDLVVAQVPAGSGLTADAISVIPRLALPIR